MFMPLCDVIDRYTILKLKVERLPENNDIIELYGIFACALEYELRQLNSFDRAFVEKKVQELYAQNSVTWNLEASIRQGKLDNPESMLEVGRRTLLIRDSNKKRVKIKNEISLAIENEKYGVEIKVDHLSEDKNDT
jgi:hypothetical protein